MSVEDSLGPVSDWQVEWKYDGIRGQVVKRAGQVWLWSRGEELVTERFPEVVALAQALPDGTVLDGEVLVWQGDRPAPFALLQQRIGRKTLTKKVLAEAPVTFMAYDLLEDAGCDLRALPQQVRRTRLEARLAGTGMRLSPVEQRNSWAEYAALRSESRARAMEGFMLKRRDAGYGTGRSKADGLWLKWKIDPMHIDCVLIYAQAGHGRRASVYTDYTFAVWNRAPHDQAEAEAVLEAIAAKRPAQPDALQLVAFAKAYSGLTDEEFRQVDAVVRKTTLEKFGPVRSREGRRWCSSWASKASTAARGTRAVLPVRFPRMLRIRARQAGARSEHPAGSRGASEFDSYIVSVSAVAVVAGGSQNLAKLIAGTIGAVLASKHD